VAAVSILVYALALVRLRPLLFMKLVVFASLLAGAATCAPTHNFAHTSVATNMAFEDELGAQAPTGLFDPLSLVGDCQIIFLLFVAKRCVPR
jgi:hypothetical protein